MVSGALKNEEIWINITNIVINLSIKWTLNAKAIMVKHCWNPPFLGNKDGSSKDTTSIKAPT